MYIFMKSSCIYIYIYSYAKSFFLKQNNQTWRWHCKAIFLEWRLTCFGKELCKVKWICRFFHLNLSYPAHDPLYRCTVSLNMRYPKNTKATGKHCTGDISYFVIRWQCHHVTESKPEQKFWNIGAQWPSIIVLYKFCFNVLFYFIVFNFSIKCEKNEELNTSI